MASISKKFEDFLINNFKISAHIFHIPSEFEGEESFGIFNGIILKLGNTPFSHYQYQKGENWKSINFIFHLHQKPEIINKINSFLTTNGLNEINDLLEQETVFLIEDGLAAGMVINDEHMGRLYLTKKI